MKKYKLLYFVSEDQYFLTHKLPHAKKAVKEGFEVFVICKTSNLIQKIEKHGIKVLSFNFDRKNVNILKEIIKMVNFFYILKKIKPDIIQSIALKPVIYACLSSIFFPKVIRVHCIVGLGYLFINKGIKVFILKLMVEKIFKFFLQRKNNIVVFQNKDDYNFFKNKKIISKCKTFIIPGSGVNVNEFCPDEKIKKKYDLILHSRMLIDKGIIELVEAFKYLKSKNFNFKLLLLGGLDQGNRATLSHSQLKEFNKLDGLTWIDSKRNVIKYIRESKIGILPSYREGFPKSLLESASCGLALISCNVAGCKEISIHEHNGLNCKPRNYLELAHNIRALMSDQKKIELMGNNSRELVIRKFSDSFISEQFSKVYNFSLKEFKK